MYKIIKQKYFVAGGVNNTLHTLSQAVLEAEESQAKPERATKGRLMQSTWETDWEMRESLFLSPHPLWPFILQGSDQRCVSRSGLHILDWSPPGVPQTAPPCLGKHERELIAFKVPWQESDAHSHRVYLDIGSVDVAPVVSRFFSCDPRCKTGHEKGPS